MCGVALVAVDVILIHCLGSGAISTFPGIIRGLAPMLRAPERRSPHDTTSGYRRASLGSG